MNELDAQEALIRQQMQSQEGMNAPMLWQNQQQVQAALVAQTDPAKILDEIELKLKGYKQSMKTGEFEQMAEPLMNDKGVNKLILNLSAIVNQNTILSHLEEEEITKMIIKVGNDLIDDLTLNWKDYGIKDEMSRDHIVNIALFPSFMALKRAWKQNEKNWLGKITIESLSNAPRVQGMRDKGKIMDRLRL